MEDNPLVILKKVLNQYNYNFPEGTSLEITVNFTEYNFVIVQIYDRFTVIYNNGVDVFNFNKSELFNFIDEKLTVSLINEINYSYNYLNNLNVNFVIYKNGINYYGYDKENIKRKFWFITKITRKQKIIDDLNNLIKEANSFKFGLDWSSKNIKYNLKLLNLLQKKLNENTISTIFSTKNLKELFKSNVSFGLLNSPELRDIFEDPDNFTKINEFNLLLKLRDFDDKLKKKITKLKNDFIFLCKKINIDTSSYEKFIGTEKFTVEMASNMFRDIWSQLDKSGKIWNNTQNEIENLNQLFELNPNYVYENHLSEVERLKKQINRNSFGKNSNYLILNNEIKYLCKLNENKRN